MLKATLATKFHLLCHLVSTQLEKSKEMRQSQRYMTHEEDKNRHQSTTPCYKLLRLWKKKMR
jgi:hypothetical protein